MKILIRLDLSKYDVGTIKTLHRERIISSKVLAAELKERGYDEWTILRYTRSWEQIWKLNKKVG